MSAVFPMSKPSIASGYITAADIGGGSVAFSARKPESVLDWVASRGDGLKPLRFARFLTGSAAPACGLEMSSRLAALQ
jgi:hypothetical protein